MARGDHIYRRLSERGPLTGLRLTHHGIDCGDGTVIHMQQQGSLSRLASTSHSPAACVAGTSCATYASAAPHHAACRELLRGAQTAVAASSGAARGPSATRAECPSFDELLGILAPACATTNETCFSTAPQNGLAADANRSRADGSGSACGLSPAGQRCSQRSGCGCTAQSWVRRDSLQDFLMGETRYYVCNHVGSWCFTPDEVVARAEALVGAAPYHLLLHNCESFATWCKIGVTLSRQVVFEGAMLLGVAVAGGLPGLVATGLTCRAAHCISAWLRT